MTIVDDGFCSFLLCVFFFLFTVGVDDDDEQQLVLLPGRTAGRREKNNNNSNSGHNSSIWNICAENAQKQQYLAGEKGVRLLAGDSVIFQSNLTISTVEIIELVPILNIISSY